MHSSVEKIAGFILNCIAQRKCQLHSVFLWHFIYEAEQHYCRHQKDEDNFNDNLKQNSHFCPSHQLCFPFFFLFAITFLLVAIYLCFYYFLLIHRLRKSCPLTDRLEAGASVACSLMTLGKFERIGWPPSIGRIIWNNEAVVTAIWIQIVSCFSFFMSPHNFIEIQIAMTHVRQPLLLKFQLLLGSITHKGRLLVVRVIRVTFRLWFQVGERQRKVALLLPHILNQLQFIQVIVDYILVDEVNDAILNLLLCVHVAFVTRLTLIRYAARLVEVNVFDFDCSGWILRPVEQGSGWILRAIVQNDLLLLWFNKMFAI